MKYLKTFETYLESDAIGYDIGDYVYHVTPKRNLDEIKRNGFKPQDGVSINNKHFKNRLYFATSLIAAYDLTVNFNSYKETEEYVIFKIDSDAISEYEEDPLFVHGIYVNYSVSKDYIIDIIDADDLFGKYDENDLDKLYLI